MNVDRRSFLKFFGVGATIAPVVGGLVNHEAQATLIEQPHVKILEPPHIEAVSALDGEYDARVILRSRSYGKTFQFECAVQVADLDPLSVRLPRHCPKCDQRIGRGVLMHLREFKRVDY